MFTIIHIFTHLQDDARTSEYSNSIYPLPDLCYCVVNFNSLYILNISFIVLCNQDSFVFTRISLSISLLSFLKSKPPSGTTFLLPEAYPLYLFLYLGHSYGSKCESAEVCHKRCLSHPCPQPKPIYFHMYIEHYLEGYTPNWEQWFVYLV